MTNLQTLDHLPQRRAVARTAPLLSTPDDREWFDTIGGERVAIVVHSHQVEGLYTMLETIAEPKAGSPLHYHREYEVFQVVEGVMTFSAGGKLLDVEPDSTIVVPAGTPHAWRNRTAKPVRMIVTFFPGGIETLFPKLAGTRPEDLPTLAAAYGSHIVGPPIED